ncbi:MAG: metal ABC transporter permease [Cyanobacteria bacterium P01_F01_bin.53]
MDWLLDPFNYEFMRQALTAGVLIGILCPIVGTYLIVQRMSMLGDVVAHAVLPGLAIANFFNIPLLTGAFVFGMLSTFVTSWIRSQSKVKVDAAMAITFSSFFSLGIALLTGLRSRLDLEELLFGDILSITPTDVWQIGFVTLCVLVGVKFFYKELLFFTFDRLGAEAVGLPVGKINFCLMAAITLTIVASIKAVGVILVVALMVSPAAAAYLLTRELHWMMAVGSGVGVLACMIGMYISYYLNTPSGPAIVLTLFGCFLLALLFSPSQGILMRGGKAPPKEDRRRPKA